MRNPANVLHVLSWVVGDGPGVGEMLEYHLVLMALNEKEFVSSGNRESVWIAIDVEVLEGTPPVAAPTRQEEFVMREFRGHRVVWSRSV